MNRREFLIAAAAVPAEIAQTQTVPASQRVSLADYGADPSGKQDSTLAIHKAVSAVKDRRARTLIFPNGIYRLASVHEVAINLSRVSNLDVDGDGSTLLMGQDARCLLLADSSSVTVHDMTIDYDPLPFTQGTVTSSGPDGLTVKIDPGFPVPASIELLAVGSYDRSIKNYAKNAVEMYGAAISRVRAVGKTDLKIELKRSVNVPVGTVLVLRFKQGHDVIGIRDSKSIAVRGVNIYAGYSLAFSISHCADLRLENTTIAMPPGSDRLLSTNADAMHITSCTGSLTIRKCTFQGMGDDAINITTGMLRLQKDGNGSNATIVKGPGVPIKLSQRPPLRLGDRIEVLDPHDLHVVAHATAQADADNTIKAQINGNPSSDINGALVVDTDLTPTTEIADCNFKGNRARAIVAHNNIQIHNCSFQNTTGSAILLAPDSSWMEGPATRNVVIKSNHFSSCHYAYKSLEGSITIDVMHSSSHRKAVPNGEASDIRISDNTFDRCPTAAITCRSADHLIIENNHVGATWTEGDTFSPPRAMVLSQLSNSSIVNNVSSAPNTIQVQDSTSTNISGNTGFVISKKKVEQSS